MLFDRDTTNCSIARTLEVVGEKWTLLILREVWYGASRFSDFERILGCPRNLLAERLRKLVEHGILSTEPYQEAGARSRLRYVITPKGNDLAPAVLGLLQWGDRYRADPAGPAIITRHARVRRPAVRAGPMRARSPRPSDGDRQHSWPRLPHEAGPVTRDQRSTHLVPHAWWCPTHSSVRWRSHTIGIDLSVAFRHRTCQDQ